MNVLYTSVVLPDRGTILLLGSEEHGWHLPNTHVQTGENVQQAAQRAVREATGVAVALTNLVGIYTDSTPAAHFVFTAYTTPDRVQPPPQSEARWATLDEAMALLSSTDSLNRVLADIQRGLRFPLGVLSE